MTRRRTGLYALLVCLLAAAFVAGYRAHVLAEGAPTMQPLFYSGSLEADGMAASGEYTVKLSLHSAATAGNQLCAIESKATVEAGRFRIDASGCADAVKANPDSWVALSFEGSDGVEHDIPRAKVGAVPYALEAQHAVYASWAENANGQLATTIASLTERLDALEAGSAQTSAFLAYKVEQQPLNDSGRIVVKFDKEVTDVGDEYTPGSGIFKAKAAGLYEFSCTLAWDVNPQVDGTWEVALELNGYEHTYDGSYNPSTGVTRSLTSVIELEKDDEVACTALQSAASGGLHVLHDGYNTFTGHRIR